MVQIADHLFGANTIVKNHVKMNSVILVRLVLLTVSYLIRT